MLLLVSAIGTFTAIRRFVMPSLLSLSKMILLMFCPREVLGKNSQNTYAPSRRHGYNSQRDFSNSAICPLTMDCLAFNSFIATGRTSSRARKRAT